MVLWTVNAAKDSGVFDEIIVCSDDPKVLALAAMNGVKEYRRPPSSDDEKDIDWLSEALRVIDCEEYALLRPTSPFRGPETIRRALSQWEATRTRLDSLRAMRRATETGWKQWVVEDLRVGDAECEECGQRHQFETGMVNVPTPFALKGGLEAAYDCSCGFRAFTREVHYSMRPLTTAAAKKHLHSFPTQSLEDTYIQTAGLEMFHRKTIESGTLAGDIVGMFLVEGPEALDINDESDWARAEAIASHMRVITGG